MNVRSVTSGTNKFSGMAQDGIYSSRFGVNGVEDLGGGLKANFHFEGGMAPDVGTSAGFNFARKSTIGLAGAFGEVRAGRDYTPLFTVHGVADPYGTNGVGSFLNIGGSTVSRDWAAGAFTAAATSATTVTTVAGSTVTGRKAANLAKKMSAVEAGHISGTFVTADAGPQPTTTPAAKAASTTDARITLGDPAAVRANNSFTYYTPTVNGFSAALMYGAGNENTTLNTAAGTLTSLKLAYANGPLNVAYATQTVKGGNAGAAASSAATTILVPSTHGTTPVATGDTGWVTTGSSITNSIIKCLQAGGTVGTTAASGGSDTCTSAAYAGQTNTENQKWVTGVLAASYDLGMAKVSFMDRQDKLTGAYAAFKASTQLYGVSAPVGALTLKASYITKKVNSAKAGDQFAVGGVYDLSKRTSVYATYAVLQNEANFANNVGSAAASSDGVESKGFEFGVKHSF